MKSFIHLSFALAIALPLGLSSISMARANSGTGVLCGNTNSCNKCPRCSAKCCELKVEQVEKEKHCWNVECETICVPRVVFPWQKSCGDPSVNNGAWTKKVRVLKKHTYTCPACEYSWTPVDRGCCGAGCGNANCVACDGMPIEMGISVQDSVVAPDPAAQQARPITEAPTPAEAASLEQNERGFIEHQKVRVASFVSRLLNK